MQEYAYGMWVVAFNVGLFLFFISSFLAPKGRMEWRNMRCGGWQYDRDA